MTSKTISEEQRAILRKWYDSWVFLLILAILIPLAIRSVLYAPFHIPSGSMKPTLLEGDFIFVSKFTYGYSNYSFPLSPNLIEDRVWFSEPKRGDIIVFRPPKMPKVDYIKRLVGLPGDRLQMQQGVLYINGKALPKVPSGTFKEKVDGEGYRQVKMYKETMPNGITYNTLDVTTRGALDNTREFYVPKGHYFFMGDNRDESQDSRTEYVTFVPAKNLVGRADIVFISTREPLWQMWTWLHSFRKDRFFKLL